MTEETDKNTIESVLRVLNKLSNFYPKTKEEKEITPLVEKQSKAKTKSKAAK